MHEHEHHSAENTHAISRLNLLLGITQLSIGAFGSKTLVGAGLHNLSDYFSYRYKAKALEQNTGDDTTNRRIAIGIMAATSGAILGSEFILDIDHANESKGTVQSAIETTSAVAEVGVVGASAILVGRMMQDRAAARDVRRHVIWHDGGSAAITLGGVFGGRLLGEAVDTAGFYMHAGLLSLTAIQSLRDSDNSTSH